MKLDKRMIDSLLGLPDDKLSAVAVAFVGRFSAEKMRDAGRITAIRRVLSQVTEEDLQRVSELMSLYRRSKR